MKRSIVNNKDNRLRLITAKQGYFPATALIIFLVSGNAAFGQTREGRKLVTAELVSDATNIEKPFTVGIRFVIESEWYLYWKNPGDAGLPIEVKWELPAGWKAEEIKFPIPSKFFHDDVTAFGYKGEVILLTTITPSPSQGLIKANLDWLVCRESCLRGGTSVSLDVSSQSSEVRTKATALLARFGSKLPGTQKESGVLLEETRLSRSGQRWTVNVKLKGTGTDEVKDFFPEIIDGVFPDFKSIIVDQNRLAMTFTTPDETVRTLLIRGLLVMTDSAYEIEIPVQLSFK